MPRARNKDELIIFTDNAFSKLKSLSGTLTAQQQAAFISVPQQRDKNLRDVLVHLYEWQRLFLSWVTNNLAGNVQSFLPPPYNWKNYQQLNMLFWQQHQSTSLPQAWQLLGQTHMKCMQLVKSLTEQQLFTKRYFPWSGTTSVGSYAASAMASHYEWAGKILARQRKLFRAKAQD